MKTYRDSGTGKIGLYPESLAKRFPNLIEVGKDAKPLAYTPVPAATIEAVKSKKEDGK